MREMIQQTQIATLIAGLLGLGAVVAGGAAGVEGLGQAGGGVVAGIGEVGARSLLSYARAQETSADRAAITFLEATHQSGRGMLRVFSRLADKDLFLARDVDPYVQSHPLPRERMELIERLVEGSRYAGQTDSPALQARHDLMRAKLSGFTETPQLVARRYPRGDNSLAARYARAVSAYRAGRLDSALPLIDELIAADGKNPFFHELKGQALLENGRARDAVPELRRAVALDPSSGLLRIMLGHAMVESGNKGLLDEAIKNLTIGLASDPNVGIGYRILGRAYAERGDVGLAQLATAQGLFADGNIKEARIQASRAQGKLTRGSPAWLRADDIVSYKPPDTRALR
jgi:predicted Zn-dependent protease